MKKLTEADFSDAGYTKVNRDKIWSRAHDFVRGTDADHDEFTMDWLVEFYIYADKHFKDNTKLIDVWNDWKKKKNIKSTETDTWRDSWRDEHVLFNFGYFFKFIDFCQKQEEDEKIWQKKKDFIDKAEITAWSKESAKEAQKEKHKIIPKYEYWT